MTSQVLITWHCLIVAILCDSYCPEQATAEAGELLARARFCAWTSRAQGSGVISYSQLLQEEEEGTGSSMDPQAGTFTAGRNGLYKVTTNIHIQS